EGGSGSALPDRDDDRAPVGVPSGSMMEAAEESSAVGETSAPGEHLESQASAAIPQMIGTEIDQASNASDPVATPHYLVGEAAVSDFVQEADAASVSAAVSHQSEPGDAKEVL